MIRIQYCCNQGAYIEGGETRSYRADRCVMRKWTGASVILNKDVEGVGFLIALCFCCYYIENVGHFRNFLTDTVDVIFFLQLMNLIVLKDVGLKD